MWMQDQWSAGRIALMVSLLVASAAICATGLFSIQFAWWRPPICWQRARILMYHMVCEHRPRTRFNKLRVPPEHFAEQLRWLSRNGFTFVFASQLFSDEPLPERCVCLTFDDGYEDNLTNADPILAQFNARATLYLVSDRSGGWSSKKKAHHADDELASEPKLTDEQVRAMVASGRWELGGHTRTHANLTALPPDEARNEVLASSVDLQTLYQTRPQTFAYPFGLFSLEHLPMVREAGFVGAVTTEPGIAARPYQEPLLVPRIKVSGNDNLFAFKMRMRGGKRGLFR
jgi:peptidoglycan/xylan/chitin deacetylase (PgdA/CDA1 family)